MASVMVLKAEDIEITDDEEVQDVPMREVEWPDGRVDTLPHTCVNVDIDVEELTSNPPILRFTILSEEFPVSFNEASLRQLTAADVYISRVGDVDEHPGQHYLRGPLSLVLEYWFQHLIEYYSVAGVFDGAFLCQHYRLLDDVPDDEEGRYAEELFRPDAPTEIAGRVVSVDISLPRDEETSFAKFLEKRGCEWPRKVADGDACAQASWWTRVDHWREWLHG